MVKYDVILTSTPFYLVIILSPTVVIFIRKVIFYTYTQKSPPFIYRGRHH